MHVELRLHWNSEILQLEATDTSSQSVTWATWLRDNSDGSFRGDRGGDAGAGIIKSGLKRRRENNNS